MAERHLAGVAAGDVPGGRGGAPDQDQDQAVEEERVAHDERRQPRQGEEDGRGRDRAHAPSASAPRWPKSPAGRTTRTPMNKSRQSTSFHAVPIRYEPPTSTAATASAGISAPPISP